MAHYSKFLDILYQIVFMKKRYWELCTGLDVKEGAGVVAFKEICINNKHFLTGNLSSPMSLLCVLYYIKLTFWSILTK